MGGHFACVGLNVGSGGELNRLLGPLTEAAEWTVRDKTGRTGLWRDSSGVLISFNTDKDGSIQCCTPGFDGPSTQRVRATSFLKDAECAFCDMLYVEVLNDDQMVYPLALQVVDLGLTRARIPMKVPVTMKIAAFADELQVWPNDEAFNRAQAKEPKFAAESLIPSGLFGPAPHPHAMITGHVAASGLRRNGATEGSFVQMAVTTFGGRFDVLAPVDLLPAPPAVGSVVQGSFWMVGQVIDGLLDPPKKRRFGLF
jgi:hypothetical protein